MLLPSVLVVPESTHFQGTDGMTPDEEDSCCESGFDLLSVFCFFLGFEAVRDFNLRTLDFPLLLPDARFDLADVCFLSTSGSESSNTSSSDVAPSPLRDDVTLRRWAPRETGVAPVLKSSFLRFCVEGVIGLYCSVLAAGVDLPLVCFPFKQASLMVCAFAFSLLFLCDRVIVSTSCSLSSGIGSSPGNENSDC